MAPAQLSADIGQSSKLNINPKVEEGLDDVAVNISEITRNDDIRMTKSDDPDATEYSSSFGDTTSANENCSGLSDVEVESQFYDDNEFTSAFDGFTNVFPMRKKKLTNHWRNFIRPLMWRCKWTELRIKEMGSQALKYNREIAAKNRRKKMELEQHKIEGCASRTFPFNFQRHRRKVLKRRKRRRVEYLTDAKSFMSNHNLFSYSEIKKSEADGAFTADDFGNTEEKTTAVSNSELSIINTDVKEEDNNFLQRIFRKMEMVHSRVQKLKGQLDIVMAKNVRRFSSSENLSHLVPCDGSVRSPTFSACNGDNNNNNNQNNNNNINILDYDNGDLVMPESAVSSFGEAILVPDIIESTVGHLSSADVTQHLHSQIGDSTENIVDNIAAIHNEATEAERKKNLAAEEKLPEAEKSGEEESSNPGGEEQSSLKSCLATEFHFPKNKRKRGERKAGGAGVWSRQCPAAEPDSQ